MCRVVRPVTVCLSGCARASAGVASPGGGIDAGNPNDVRLFEVIVIVLRALTLDRWGCPGGVNASGTVIPSGGFDPCLAGFERLGPKGVCGDSPLVLTGLTPGSCTVALSVFLSMLFAENCGCVRLGDGLVGLGGYYVWTTYSDRTSAFAIDVSGEAAGVLELSSLSCLWLTVLVGLICLRRRAAEARYHSPRLARGGSHTNTCALKEGR